MVDWEKAQKEEANYWGNCLGMTAWGEFVKQELYGREMGLFDEYGDGTGELNMRGRAVLDVGGGPMSMTLRCVNTIYPTVVDPCEWPASVHRRYKKYGIHFVRSPGEELDKQELALRQYDEVWCYNVLQHVQDPAAVVKNTLARVTALGVLRIFEWLYIPTSDCHLHLLTPEGILTWLSGARILKVGILRIQNEYWSNASAFVGVFQP